MNFTKRLSLKIVPLIAFGVLASGCAAGGTYEETLTSEAKSGENLTLPQENSPVDSWEHVAVLCPYSTPPANLPAAMKTATEQINTDTDDSQQWLVFGKGSDAESIALSRAKIDFCSSATDNSNVYPADQQWSVQEGDEGVLVLSIDTTSKVSS
ncbi:hypothetical protein ACFO7V_06585 [Glutamicibacter bergerei]|uniref:Lipoprotein n=1 Tax=Glutamicibacter bergerei TaxID=256702 RepID=A0ABV9MKX5_9MICC|nr:hypothetical protein [Glutamicibacter sp. BW80]HBV10422.1 hypothetical protein [Micrococcaceae bacterium]